MSQITARVPDELVAALDTAAATLKRSRAEIVRQALERYLEDFDDLGVALERLRDPADPVLDWDQVRHELLGRIKRSAAKELARIPRPDRLRLVQSIDGLAERPLTGSPLKGRQRGLRRVRLGDYRIVYELLDAELVVLVVRVAHRREVYRHR